MGLLLEHSGQPNKVLSKLQSIVQKRMIAFDCAACKISLHHLSSMYLFLPSMQTDQQMDSVKLWHNADTGMAIFLAGACQIEAENQWFL